MTEAVSLPTATPRTAEDDAEECRRAAAALGEAIERSDLGHFYGTLRAAALPFRCAELQDDAPGLFRICARLVATLGAVSPAVALAVENHLYVTSAIATFPTEGAPELERRRRALLDAIVERRCLVANTNSRVHGGKVGGLGTSAGRRGAGFVIDGMAAYTSLATEADLLVLMTEIEGEGPALFVIDPLRGNPAVEIGDYLFPRAMIDSDTRKITFRRLELPADALLAGAGDLLVEWLFPFEMAWHQLLIAALYLGAAAGAVEQARRFLRATSGRDGRPLAELDGQVVDIGRLALEHRAAGLALARAGQALGGVRRLPRDGDAVERCVDLASAVKYTGTRSAEAIVAAARRTVGARTYGAGSQLERLCDEVVFGTLGPEVGAVAERRYGKAVIERDSFLDFIE